MTGTLGGNVARSHLFVSRISLVWLVAALFFLDVSGQAGCTTFRMFSGKSVRMKIEGPTEEGSRIVFETGDRNQVLRISRYDAIPVLDSFPTRSRVISLTSMKEPLVLAYSSEAGASDCTYRVTAIGVEDGELPRFVSSDEITFSNEGGAAIWATGPKTTMVVWSPIWAGREGHYDAHRYVYFWYSWNPSRHKFQYTRSTHSKKRLDYAEDSLDLTAPSTIEISYRTRAAWFPEAADGC